MEVCEQTQSQEKAWLWWTFFSPLWWDILDTKTCFFLFIWQAIINQTVTCDSDLTERTWSPLARRGHCHRLCTWLRFSLETPEQPSLEEVGTSSCLSSRRRFLRRGSAGPACREQRTATMTGRTTQRATLVTPSQCITLKEERKIPIWPSHDSNEEDEHGYHADLFADSFSIADVGTRHLKEIKREVSTVPTWVGANGKGI